MFDTFPSIPITFLNLGTMSAKVGTIRRLWYGWKSLKLPWRRQFLVGADLSGNTFWEFKDHMNASRMRRIVRYNPRTHYGDVKISRKLRKLPIETMLLD